MCHAILITLRDGADVDAAAQVLSAHGRRLHPAEVRISNEPGWQVYVTSRDCDCGTPIGAARAPTGRPSTRDLEKLRKKGWSETKIRRWREEHEKTSRRRQAKTAHELDRAEPELSAWLARLAALLEAERPRSIGLALAWSPPPRLMLDGKSAHSIDEISSRFLFEMRESWLYEITAAG